MSTPFATLPKITLKPRKALPFHSRHPWVFAGAIDTAPAELSAGTEVLVESAERKPIARGLYNEHSNIRVRLYEWQLDSPIDPAFWEARLQQAVALRTRLFSATAQARDGRTTALRLVNSEGDGLSGLTVDQFGDYLVVQFTSLAVFQFRDVILDCLERLIQPAGILCRTEKGIRELEGLDLEDGLLRGQVPPEEFAIEEQGLTFEVDLTAGQKTGFYCDQRDNRRRVAQLAPPGELLDVCCYSGGFAINALKMGDATSATLVDSSSAALDLALRNAQRNGVAERVSAVHSRADEAMAILVEEGRQFATVVLDPPKMVRHRAGLEKALAGYQRLNEQGIALTQAQGLFVTCSCSGHVSHDDFAAMVARAALAVGRNVQVLEERGAGADHPALLSCPETRYLQALICRVLP